MNLVLIPARGGSKGIPKKNIKLLMGKPLLVYTIEAARGVFSDQEIIVSTDAEEIVQVVEKEGLKVPFIRPSELATDTSDSHGVILHALDFFEEKYGKTPDRIILLQPTSPFRTSKHVKEAISLYDTFDDVEMLVSVKETLSNPYYVLMEEDKDGYLKKSKESKVTRRQDLPKVWELNGAIYIINPYYIRKKHMVEFQKIRKYVMDPISSHDIDTILDWEMASVFIEKKLM